MRSWRPCRRDIALLGLLDGQPHRLVVGDIAKRPMPVDDAGGSPILDDDPRRTGTMCPTLMRSM